MSQPIVRILLGDLESFLAKRAEMWEYELNSLQGFEEYLPDHRPVDVSELIFAFFMANRGADHVFLFGSEMTPEEALEIVDLENLQSVEESEMDDYIIRFHRAKDYLYVAPGLEEVANGFYINLMPVDEEELEEDDDTDEDEEFDEFFNRGLVAESRFRLDNMCVNNFKGIGSPTGMFGEIRIDFKPITLLFGSNSSGKSSILHAILYAREIFERRNLDARTTQSGGSLLDLGGFEKMVHNRERGNWISLVFAFQIGDRLIPSYAPSSPSPYSSSFDSSSWPEIGKEVHSAEISVHVGWSELREICYVSDYQVQVNGIHIASIQSNVARREVELYELNLDHPLLKTLFFNESLSPDSCQSLMSALEPISGNTNQLRKPIPIVGQIDALPAWGKALHLLFANVLDESIFYGESKTLLVDSARLSALLSQILVGIGEVLRDGLSEFCYLGPFREPPPRDFSPAGVFDPSRWANGLAAWDSLYRDDQDLVERVSRWFSDPSRLNTGYALTSSTIAEIDLASLMAAFHSEVLLEETNDLLRHLPGLRTRKKVTLVDESHRSRDGSPRELHPCDVGIGISQVLPVVVLALDRGVSFCAMEQPELHVHPKLQVSLGDLFISKIYNQPDCRFLIETHSEHLLLRLLRRIRETYEGDISPNQFPSIHPDQIGIYFVEANEGHTVVRSLRIDETGEFIDRWPHGFFEERAKELF